MLPFCLYPPCAESGKRHWFDDCTDCREKRKSEAQSCKQKEKGWTKTEVEQLNPPDEYNFPVKEDKKNWPISLKCSQRVRIPEILLDCRHGTVVTLRNTSWLVSEQDADEALLGRTDLRRLGLDTTKLFRTAAASNNGCIDFDLEEDNPRGGKVSRILDQGMYHSSPDDGNAEEIDRYV